MSSAEAELFSFVELGKELIWVREMMKEMWFYAQDELWVKNDSRSLMDMIDNLGTTVRTKHFRRQLGFARQLVKKS